MVQYAINHYVTSGSEPMESTVHGDDSLAVWVDGDPATASPDQTHEPPSDGWTWRTDTSGWQEHPSVLKEYVSDVAEIERLSPWDTTLTDGVTR